MYRFIIISTSYFFWISSYKQNPVSVIQTITDEVTGEERQRYVNKNLWKANSMAIISIEDEEVSAQLLVFSSANYYAMMFVRSLQNRQTLQSMM